MPFSKSCLLVAFFLGCHTVSISRADILGASFGPNFADGSVARYEDDGTLIVGGGIPQFSGGIGLPGGITKGPDGHFYVASLNGLTGEGNILKYHGETLTPLGLFGTMPFVPPSGASPARLKFGPDGNLYVADMAGTSIRIFDGTNGALLPGTALLPEAENVFSGPTALTFGPDGALYVGNFNTATIDRVAGGVKTTFVAQATSPMYTPSAMLFLSTGEMLVADTIGNQLLKFGSNGNYIPSFDEEMNPVPFAVIPPEIPNPLPDGANFPSNNPSDIAFDPQGNLLVAVLGINYPPNTPGAILRYDLEGNLLDEVVENVYGVTSLLWIPAEDAIVGDYDTDGDVDSADYAKWRSDFGKWVAPGGGSDGNTSGIVNAADYVIWRDHLVTHIHEATAVPEPTAWVIALAASLGWLVLRARKMW